jgi:hypothetical protein
VGLEEVEMKIRNLAGLLLFIPCLLVAQDAVEIVHGADMDSTFAAVLNQVKRQGLEIESASTATGIRTGLTVRGGYRQTGTHYELTFISDGPGKTAVRVAAYEQKRFKALAADPWSGPKLNPTLAQTEAQTLRAGLGW